MRNIVIVITLAFVLGLVAIAIVFVPVIFGSAEANIDITNNTTVANLRTTTTLVQADQMILWVVGILAGLFMVAVILLRR